MIYFKKIDGLRFVAIFLVLLEHFAGFIGTPISAGYYGVDLFFVISGFLITGILIKENNQSFRKSYFNFIARRTIRIFPIYYLTIGILWLLQLPTVREYIKYLLTYTFNYAIVNFHLPFTPVTHFWTLNIEEQFYLFWPIIILSLKKKSGLLLFITSIIIVLGYVQLSFNIFPAISEYDHYGLFTRMSSLGIGAMGSLLANKKLLPSFLLKNIFFEYFMIALLSVSLIFTFQYKALFLGICSFYLVIKAAYFDFSINVINRFLVHPFVIYIGTISYGIYVYHMILEHYLSLYVFDPFFNSINYKKLGKLEILQYNLWLIKFPLYSIFSVIVAACSFKYIESPLLALKDKYFKNHVSAKRFVHHKNLKAKCKSDFGI